MILTRPPLTDECRRRWLDGASARLRQLRHEHDLPRLGDRPQGRGDVIAKLLDQRVAGRALDLHVTARNRECDDRLSRGGSVAPMTAASATDGWLTSADSTSVVEALWPDASITSSNRPSSLELATC